MGKITSDILAIETAVIYLGKLIESVNNWRYGY